MRPSTKQAIAIVKKLQADGMPVAVLGSEAYLASGGGHGA
jgi:hypothetical protein